LYAVLVLVSLTRSLYENQTSHVRTANGTSEWFTVLRGVRQVFNIMRELLMRLALDGFEGGFRIEGRLVTNSRYADDIVLIASTIEELQLELANRVHNAAGSVGSCMRLNLGAAPRF